MTPTESAGTPKWDGPKSDKQFLGHPVGLFVLFFTEMWERFSFYGMRGLLKLYMVNYLFITIRQTYQGKAFDGTGNPDDVLGWAFIRGLLPTVDITDPKIISECIVPAVKRLTTAAQNPVAADVARNIAEQTCAISPNASVMYGWYMGLIYFTPLFGGYLADKYLGQKRAVIIGGAIMAAGQFLLFGAESMFFIGLLVLILGNGLFKPNISTQVGNLYPAGDARRDGAFTIFYMGINLGAFLCNFVCGTLAAVYGWRYGFLAAGIGMCFGVIVQLFGQRFLAPDTLQARRISPESTTKVAVEHRPFDKGEWSRITALIVLCALNIIFWAVYEQQGNTMQTWADEQTTWPSLPNLVVYGLGGGFVGALLGAVAALILVMFDVLPSVPKRIGQVALVGTLVGIISGYVAAVALGDSLLGSFQIPSTYFQSANPFFIFLLAPLFDMLWRWQNKRGREPASVTKMAIGCFVLGGSFIVMIIGANVVGADKGSWFWPIFCTLLLTVGELYLSPIGLSLVTKVSPVRIVSMMMGIWFLSSFFGNILSGYIGRLYTSMPKEGFFAILMVLGVAAGLAIWAFNKRLKTAMGSSAT